MEREVELVVPPLETGSVLLGMCETQVWYTTAENPLSALSALPAAAQCKYPLLQNQYRK